MSTTTDKPTATMSVGDANALEWYHGQGQSAFQRSTCGPMLERLQRDAFTSATCAKCHGVGIVEENGVIHDATGREKKIKEAGGWCERCKGTGHTPVRVKASKNELTAKPKGSSSESEGYVPDDYTLTRFAIISRRMSIVENLSAEAARTLAAYHGDQGERWARTERGRLFAIYSLTESGKALALRAAEHAECLSLSYCDRIAFMAELQRKEPKPWRGQLLAGASREAAALYQAAVLIWKASKPRRREVETEIDMRDPVVGPTGNQVYISMAECAAILEWTVERTRDWMIRNDAVIKKGRHYYTTRERLRVAFPEVLERIDLGGA